MPGILPQYRGTRRESIAARAHTWNNEGLQDIVLGMMGLLLIATHHELPSLRRSERLPPQRWVTWWYVLLWWWLGTCDCIVLRTSHIQVDSRGIQTCDLRSTNSLDRPSSANLEYTSSPLPVARLEYHLPSFTNIFDQRMSVVVVLANDRGDSTISQRCLSACTCRKLGRDDLLGPREVRPVLDGKEPQGEGAGPDHGCQADGAAEEVRRIGRGRRRRSCSPTASVTSIDHPLLCLFLSCFQASLSISLSLSLSLSLSSLSISSKVLATFLLVVSGNDEGKFPARSEGSDLAHKLSAEANLLSTTVIVFSSFDSLELIEPRRCCADFSVRSGT